MFRGSGGQIKFLIEKKDGEAYWYRRSGPGKDIGLACLLYMGDGGAKNKSLRSCLVIFQKDNIYIEIENYPSTTNGSQEIEVEEGICYKTCCLVLMIMAYSIYVLKQCKINQ